MKFKNTLEYVDKFNDLIKFAFDKKYNISGFLILAFAFIIPVLFFIGYSAVPLEKYIKNPYVVSGIIKEYCKFVYKIKQVEKLREVWWGRGLE